MLGAIITISEPDLQVLAEQVPSVPNRVLILVIACGVGMFLVAAVLRMLFGIPLSKMLVVCYLAVFAVACFVPKDFLAVALRRRCDDRPDDMFRSSWRLVSVSRRHEAIRHAADDSFGLIALCSIGPILSVLILGLLYAPEGVYEAEPIVASVDSVELWRTFLHAFPDYMREIAVAMFPIVLFFGLFQIISLKMNRNSLVRIFIGLIYTYIGLVLFLTGVNVGFMPVGTELGRTLASLPYRWCIVPIGMVIGYFIVMAEPAVHVLTHQVEEMTSGAIPAKAMSISLSAGVAISLGLAMVRVLTGLSILWFLVPGYAAGDRDVLFRAENVHGDRI